MNSPKPPAADPAVAQAAAREKARAEAENLKLTQASLQSTGAARRRRFGSMLAPIGSGVNPLSGGSANTVAAAPGNSFIDRMISRVRGG